MTGIVSQVRRGDPRVKAACGVVFSLLAWRADWPGLAVYSAVLLPLVRALAVGAPDAPGPRVVRTYGLFILFWVGVKAAMDLVFGGHPAEVAADCAVLGLRLVVLVLTGLFLALSTSTRQLGLALTWFLRPFSRQNAWRAALALALMVHNLPLAWAVAVRVRDAVRLRLGRAPFRVRLMVIPGTVLRSLAARTWEQTLAVAGRGLDGPEAWARPFPPARGSLTAGGAACLAGLALALL